LFLFDENPSSTPLTLSLFCKEERDSFLLFLLPAGEKVRMRGREGCFP